MCLSSYNQRVTLCLFLFYRAPVWASFITDSNMPLLLNRSSVPLFWVMEALLFFPPPVLRPDAFPPFLGKSELPFLRRLKLTVVWVPLSSSDIARRERSFFYAQLRTPGAAFLDTDFDLFPPPEKFFWTFLAAGDYFQIGGAVHPPSQQSRTWIACFFLVAV